MSTWGDLSLRASTTSFFLFTLLQSPKFLGSIMFSSNDTQMILNSISTSRRLEPDDQISALQSCLVSLQTWFCQNRMVLNPVKSDAILTGKAQCVHCYSNLTSVNVAGTTISLTSNISILGGKLDANLTLDNHTNSVSQSCFIAFITSVHCARFVKLLPQ